MSFSVRRSLAWMTLSQGGLFVMQFGASLVIARLLTPYEMGVFAVAAAIVGLLGALRAIGLGNYIIRAGELGAAELAGVFTINVVLAVVVAVLIAGLSELGGALLGEPGVRHVLLVMTVLPLLSMFELMPASRIERGGNFRVVAVVNLVRTLVANVVMLGFAFAGFSYMSLAYGQIAGGVVAVVGMNIVGRHFAVLRLGFTGWNTVLRYGLQILAISGINMVAWRLAELLLGRLLGLSSLGLYSRASGLSNMLSENFNWIIARVVFVDLSEQRRRGVSLRNSYLRILEITTGLLWPAFAGIAILSGPVVLILYGETWIAAALPLSLLSVSAIILVAIAMTWEVFVVSEETAQQAKIEFVRSGVGLVLFTAGCLIGLAGAAAARIAEALFCVAVYRPHLDRMTETSLEDCMPIYRRSAVLTVLAVAPAAAVMAAYGWSAQTPLGLVLAAVAMGVAAWVGGLRAMRHPLFDEGRLALARLRPG